MSTPDIRARSAGTATGRGRCAAAVRTRWLWVAMALAVLVLQAAPAAAASVRSEEIADCRRGEIATWTDGRDRPAVGGEVRLLYRHAGAPPRFDEGLVLGAVQRAANAWAACGVPALVVTEVSAALSPQTLVVVQWDDSGARGNFGLADLGRRTLSLGPAAFQLLATRNPRHPASDVLQMVISHEMGHFFGLMAHSRRCVDVMSYYDDGHGQVCSTRDGGSPKAVPEYRALLPTACDIARCRAVNAAR